MKYTTNELKDMLLLAQESCWNRECNDCMWSKGKQLISLGVLACFWDNLLSPSLASDRQSFVEVIQKNIKKELARILFEIHN